MKLHDLAKNFEVHHEVDISGRCSLKIRWFIDYLIAPSVLSWYKPLFAPLRGPSCCFTFINKMLSNVGTSVIYHPTSLSHSDADEKY